MRSSSSPFELSGFGSVVYVFVPVSLSVGAYDWCGISYVLRFVVYCQASV